MSLDSTFQNVLSKETIAKSIQNLEYLGEFYYFIGISIRVLGDNHLQQAAVARIIVFFIIQGLDRRYLHY